MATPFNHLSKYSQNNQASGLQFQNNKDLLITGNSNDYDLENDQMHKHINKSGNPRISIHNEKGLMLPGH